jgi:hypothetical protein
MRALDGIINAPAGIAGDPARTKFPRLQEKARQ